MKGLILSAIRFYQKTGFFHKPILRTLFMTDHMCRFLPTCSDYTYQAVDKYGVRRGLWLGIKRIVRCHPWNKGGIDKLP